MTLPSCSLALQIFPRLLGAIYLIAFLSLLIQVPGLYSSQGILPIAERTALLRRHLGPRAYRLFPSLFWIDARDIVLVGCAWAGVALSLLLLAGVATLPALLGLWLLYLSFVSLGQEFLSYQWDALLLETGFMTIFLPLVTPSPLVALAYQFFVFRFILSAGVVKLASGDPTWRRLRALCYHYETQPLPNRIAWYAHQLPAQVQTLCTLGTFFFELVVPFLFLGPAPLRLAGFVLLIVFQTLLMLSGSYGFFNLLTIVLAVPLLDDRYLAALTNAAPPEASSWIGSPLDVIFLVFILLNALQLVRLFWRPAWLAPIFSACGSWWISSPYGLFAVMTTERYEFEIEGSMDREEWRPYVFRWKPGNPAIVPRQAAPHQPRLDWQMWFAALNPLTVEPWLERLLGRLLEGSAPVQALFREVPFHPVPPRYLRLKVYRYHFTDWATRRASGQWWRREEIGTSMPLTRSG